MRTSLATAAAAACALMASSAAAETIITVAHCQLPNGMTGQMVTQTEVYRTGGLVYPGGSQSMPDFVSDGQYSTHHAGVFRSPLGEHRFSGEGRFINFGHRGPVFQVVWTTQRQYILRDAYNSGWGDIPCAVQSFQ